VSIAEQSTITAEQVMRSVNWPNEVTEILKAAQQNANARAIRYNIHDTYRYHDKLGICWLTEGGPKNQTYKSETALIRERAEAIANMINNEAVIKQRILDAQEAAVRVRLREAKKAERKARKEAERIAKGLPPRMSR
jgi:hypothetical protein